MKVTLLSRSVAPVNVCRQAAAVCTGADDWAAALRGAMASGHESVLEHASFTFKVEGVSRVLLAQLTRHRLASFSVQSQRYCGVNPVWVVPEKIRAKGWEESYISTCNKCYWLYQQMIEDGVPEEDARFVIPQGITCELVMTMNVRELRHFFSLRTCNRAQWEIRELADEMLKLCKREAAELFKGAGCACMAGKPCPEGKRSCGHPRGKED